MNAASAAMQSLVDLHNKNAPAVIPACSGLRSKCGLNQRKELFLADFEKEPSLTQPALPSLWRYEQPPAPSSLYDLRTQSEVLAALLIRPGLLRESFGDLTASDFGGSVHQSLFRTLLKLEEENVEFDIPTVAEAWSGSDKTVGDALAYLSDVLNTHNVELPVGNIRRRAEKLHRLSHLRRLRFLGEALQRHADNAQTDPHALIEKLEVGIGALRAGYDLNGELLPYAPRNLARRPDLVPLSSIEAKSVPWLWEPYLSYGMISLLSGEPGSGKTFLALAFAAALTVGKVPFAGDSCSPHDVVYLSIENSLEYSIRPRFDSLEGDASRFHALRGAVIGEGPKARREGVRLSDIPLLESALKQSKAKFLVVDPIQSFLGAEVDSHRSNETRPILDGLGMLVEKYGVCLLVLRHFSKNSTGSAINRGLGSIDITAAARTEMHAGKRNDQCVLAQAKSNIGPFGPSLGYEIKNDVFRWTGETSITADDLALTGSLAEDERDAVNEATQCLADILKSGPRPANEIFSQTKDLGFSSATMRRAKVKLGVKSRKTAGEKYGHFEWFLEGYEEGPFAAS
jgi:hypothetical protein